LRRKTDLKSYLRVCTIFIGDGLYMIKLLYRKE
jgi:hypothetical protein